ncbi:hypothetical protein KC946_01830 [Candidatus Saccharibacteria bacterium]|nr:hypothetical protein [Candidatus Saccharibacteria bacterium]
MLKIADRCKGLLRISFSAMISVVLMVGVFIPALAATPTEISTWTTEANALPQTRVEQGTAEYNGYVYQVGGSGGTGVRTSTVYAQIEAGGSIGEWQESSYDLPQESYRLSAEAHDGYLYAIGGRNGPALNTIYRAAIDPETGAPGEWSAEANTLPAVRYYHSTFIFQNYLYVVGGDNNGGAVNTVYSAPIVDGSIGVWTQADDDLPANISLSTVEVLDDYVYLLGGFAESASASVYYAVVTDEGNIGNWVLMDDALPQGVQGASSVVIDDEIFVIGGYNGASRLNTIYSATISEPGETADGWSLAEATLPTAMDQGGAITYDGETYTFGGLADSFQSAVYSTISPSVVSMDTLPAEDITDGGGTMHGETQLGGGLTVDDIPESLLVGFHFNTEPTVDWENNTHSSPVETVEEIEGDNTHISFSGEMDDLDCDTQYWYVAAYQLIDGENSSIGVADNTETFTTAACTDSDNDADGISSAVEDDSPNDGDGNNDGAQDSEQANVASMIDPVSGEYAVLEVDEQCSIESLEIDSEAEVSDHQDGTYDYPAGLMDFRIDCGEGGFTATITQYYYGISGDFEVRKFKPDTGYFNIEDASTSNQTIDNAQVKVATYQVKDGSSLDLDGEVDGAIEDPAGLGQAGSGSSDLANTGSSALTAALLAFSAILLSAAMLLVRRDLI